MLETLHAADDLSAVTHPDVRFCMVYVGKDRMYFMNAKVKFSTSHTKHLIYCLVWSHLGMSAQGDACTYSHGVYECWLHPAKYRTQLCKDGAQCRRPVCFFAHSVSELRSPTYTWENGEVSTPPISAMCPGILSYIKSMLMHEVVKS